MEVLASDLEEIDLDPKTEEDEIEQCIAIILNTFQNSVPFMRSFGMSTTHYGKPLTGDENDIVDEVYDQIEKYEPRAALNDVDFYEDQENGSLEIGVNYTIDNEDDADEEEDDE